MLLYLRYASMLAIFSFTQLAQANNAIEELIVTAQKRVESQQEVAASFNVYSEANLEAAGWKNVTDLANTIPSVELIGSSKSRTSVFIRSIGTNKYDIGTEGSIGVFVDGIYVPRFSSLMQNLLDLERVEVLKGPQGTLYGRNTIGGAISLYTKPAQYEWINTISVEAGREGSNQIALRTTGPITDELLVYIGAARSETTGFRKNLTTGNTDDEIVESGRFKLTWLPTDLFEASFTLDYSDMEETALLNESLTPTNEIFLISPLLVPQSTIDSVVANEAQDFYTSTQNIDGGARVKALATNISLKWNSDDLIFESLTGLRDEDVNEAIDSDALPFDILTQITQQGSKTLSQEFKLASEEGGKYSMDYKLEWLVGAFLYSDKANRTDQLLLGADSTAGVLAFPPFNVTGPYDLGFLVDLETTSWALFAEAGYYFTDEWHVTAGIRFSRDTKDFTYTAFANSEPQFVFAEDNFSFDDTLRFESTDPKVVLQWEPEFAPDFNAYLSYTQGYKSGGIQFIARREPIAKQSFDKEILKATELGFKSRWFGQSLQVNASLYNYDYQNQQIDGIVLDGDATMIITGNAGASTVNGVELDIVYKPLPQMLIQFSYAYMDAYFDEYLGPGGRDLAGFRLPSSPKHSFWFSSEYNHWMENNWELSMRVDYAWRDDQAYAADAYFGQEAYGLLNVGIWLIDPNDQLNIRLSCQNCADQKYATNVTQLTPVAGRLASGNGRTYGISAKYNF